MPDIAPIGNTARAPFANPDALSQPEQLLAGFFSASTAGLCILDADLRYIAVNTALAEMMNRAAADHLGGTLREMVGEGFADLLEPECRRVLFTGESVRDFEVSAVLPSQTETGHWIVNCFPIKGADGRVARIGMVMIEITEQKLLEQRLEALAQRLLLKKERLQILREIDQALSSHNSMRGLFQGIAGCIAKILPYDLAGIWFDDQANQVMVAAALDSRVGEVMGEGEATPFGESIWARSILSGMPESLDHAELTQVDFPSVKKLLQHGIKSVCSLPLISPKGPLGALGLGSCRDQAFSLEDIAVLNHAAISLALALENTMTRAALEQQKERLQGLLEVSKALAESKVDFRQGFPPFPRFCTKWYPTTQHLSRSWIEPQARFWCGS